MINTQFNIGNVSANAIAAVEAATPGTREHGAAIAVALMEGYGLAQPAAAVAQNIDALIAEAVAQYAKPQHYSAFKLGQIVLLNGKIRARVMDIARNGVWIIRSATDGEWLRGNHIGGQVKERVSLKSLVAA